MQCFLPVLNEILNFKLCSPGKALETEDIFTSREFVISSIVWPII